jgi:hypothetical protein
MIPARARRSQTRGRLETLLPADILTNAAVGGIVLKNKLFGAEVGIKN